MSSRERFDEMYEEATQRLRSMTIQKNYLTIGVEPKPHRIGVIAVGGEPFVLTDGLPVDLDDMLEWLDDINFSVLTATDSYLIFCRQSEA